MLYKLAAYADQISFLNLFQYITFRSGGAFVTSLFLSLAIAPHLIAWLKATQAAGQPIRDIGPDHQSKAGTPTMGGLMILIAVLVSTLLWADLSNGFVWCTLAVTLGYGFLGFIDDYLKLTKRNHHGLSGKKKILGQVIIGTLAVIITSFLTPETLSHHLAVPFLKDTIINLSWFFIPWALVVIIGASNAVNLTDGLDGLAIVPIAIAAASFAIIVYLVGHIKYAAYLHLPYVPNTGELAIMCAAVVGGSMGFLWYNAPPAQVFMGDTRSLSLGGFLGILAVISKHELILAIIGGLFVVEALSVIIQVFYYKRTKKRIFLMAPLHHHFEKKGWSESTIVIRFWIIAFFLALVGLASLKIR